MLLDPEEAKKTVSLLSDASTYWKILANLIPLSLVGGVVAMALNLSTILQERTWLRRILGCVCVVAVGCVSAGVAALGLSLFITRPSPELQIVSSAVAGSMGQRVFDIYGRRIFGPSYVHRDESSSEPENPHGVS